MKNLFVGCLCALSVCFWSCDKKDHNGPEKEDVSGKTLIETTVKNPDGSSGASYLQLIPDFSKQNLNNKNSIQVGFDSGIKVYKKSIFVCPEFGKDGRQELLKYTYDGTKSLGAPAVLKLPSMSGAYNLVVLNDTKAYLPFYNLGKIWVFNPETMTQTGEIDLTSYGFSDNNPDPAYLFIRDGLLYVPLNQIGATWMPYLNHKQVDVAIIDAKTDEVLKVISEKTSGLTFPTRPFLEHMIFADESNDIYIACAGGFGLDLQFSETGFVCIRSNQTEFDSSASWDISQTLIQGSNYKPGSIHNCKYIGNGKVFAYVAIQELIGNNPYAGKYCMAVLIDMKAKTIKKIEGAPISDGHSVFINRYKNQVVFAAYGDKEAGFFTYDPATDKVSDGPVISTVGNPIYIHTFE